MTWRTRLTLAALAAAFLPRQGLCGADELPVFDTHVHYSRPAWDAYPPAAVLDLLEGAGVPRALVSSTPDDGTVTLHEADPGRIVPILRPYTDRVSGSTWFRDPGVPDYLEERLRRGIYRGLGEFHLFDESQARSPILGRVIELAVDRDILLHVHSGAGPVEALFALEPRLTILWAHAGMSEPPQVVGRLLDRYPRLWAEVSFRGRDIAPNGRLAPAWHALLRRHAGRFMIGTDTYVNGRWDVYGALVEEHRTWLAQLPAEVAKAIAHGNAVRLFGSGDRDELAD